MYFRQLQHLLPNSRAWRITARKTLRRFFEGLTGVGEDARDQVDGVWSNLFPQSTVELDQFEEQFALSNTLTDLQERRDRLDARWKAFGGQDPKYIQDTLQAAGFDVYVHEWWVPGSEPPLGVKAAATARAPLLYLYGGTTPIPYFSEDGAPDMQDGDVAVAMDGASADPTGYVLVNKLLVPTTVVRGDGSEAMADGDPLALDGSYRTTYDKKVYTISPDAATYPYFLYIGGETFPDKASVSVSRRNEFETLCLKICPIQLWLGILVEYS